MSSKCIVINLFGVPSAGNLPAFDGIVDKGLNELK